MLHVYACTKNLTNEDITENRQKWLSNQYWLARMSKEINEKTGKWIKDREILKQEIRRLGVWYEYWDLKKSSKNYKDIKVATPILIEETWKQDVIVDKDTLLQYVQTLEDLESKIGEMLDYFKQRVGIEEH